MGNEKMTYRTIPLLFGVTIFFSNALFIYMLPKSDGRIARLIQAGDGLSTFGWVIVFVSLLMAVLFVRPTMRALYGKSPIEIDNGILKVHSFRNTTVDLKEISEIISDHGYVTFFSKDMSKKKVNFRPFKGVELFLEELRILIKENNSDT